MKENSFFSKDKSAACDAEYDAENACDAEKKRNN